MLLEEIGKKLKNRKNLARLPDLTAESVPPLAGGYNRVSKQRSAYGIDKGGKGKLERTTHDCIKHIFMSQIHLDDFSLLDRNKPLLLPIF